MHPRILEESVKKFAGFQLEPADGIPIEGSDVFGATRRTLRQFLSACHPLRGFLRDILISNPEAARSIAALVRVLSNEW
jgi:transaldolase